MPLFQKSFRQAEILVCTTCRTVKLEQDDFDQLIGLAPVPLAVDEEVELPDLELDETETVAIPGPNRAARPKTAHSGFWLAGASAMAGAGSVVLLVLLVIGFLIRDQTLPSGTRIMPRILDHQPILPLVQADGVELPPEPEPVVVVAPKPAEPKPTPAPSNPQTVDGLVKAGWTAIETSPAQALVHFRKALAMNARHGDANYGYGYALLVVGRPLDARPHLCLAAATGDTLTKREIKALLAQNRLTCEP